MYVPWDVHCDWLKTIHSDEAEPLEQEAALEASVLTRTWQLDLSVEAALVLPWVS